MLEIVLIVALIVIAVSSLCCAIFLFRLGYGMFYTHEVIMDASNKLDKIIELLETR